MKHRNPYVGEGADGARRSAEIDRTEADGLDVADPRYSELQASAEAWETQARAIDAESAVFLREHGTRLLDHEGPNVLASLYVHDGRALVYWNDGLVNEWAELYDTLPLALHRYALLLEAEATDPGGESSWFCQTTPEAFAEAWERNRDAFLTD